MALLYSNENIPRPVVDALRLLGHDVMTVLEAGHANRRVPDEAVLEFASRLHRIVLTINARDFRRLHRQRADHAGIIVCSMDRDFVGQAARIHAVLEGAAGNWVGRLRQVDRGGVVRG